MSKEMIGDVPGNVLGMLEDLFLKLRKGVLSPDELELFLKKKNPFALPSDLLIDWQNFWKRMGIDADLRKVKIPKKPKGFDRLLVNPLTPQKAYELCASKFKCWKYSNESLDKIVVHEDRTAKDGAYAVWVRERVEPDEELKGKSANDLVGMKVFGNTLTEALFTNSSLMMKQDSISTSLIGIFVPARAIPMAMSRSSTGTGTILRCASALRTRRTRLAFCVPARQFLNLLTFFF